MVYAGLPCISVIVAVLYVRVSHRNMEKGKKKTCFDIIAHGVTPSGC